MPGTLVVVATPIGNLDDLSPRAAEVLCTADLILAEDTRRTGRLLARIESSVPQRSLHEHNERERIGEVLERLVAGARVALVSDAGTPTVSDPGLRLVAACGEAGVRVEVVPGPSAPVAALAVAGLPTDRWVFEGFLPRRGAARRERLAALATEARTVVLFLTPHRAAQDLADLAGALGADRPAVLCRELTKLHEEVRRASLADLAAGARDGLRGEVTLVVAGAEVAATASVTDDEVVARVASLVAAGRSRRDAIGEVAAVTGRPRREVYQAVVDAGS